MYRCGCGSTIHLGVKRLVGPIGLVNFAACVRNAVCGMLYAGVERSKRGDRDSVTVCSERMHFYSGK